MKKIQIIFLSLFLFAVGSYVRAGEIYNYQTGDVLLGVSIKSATPGLGTDWGEFNVDNETAHVFHDAKPGFSSIGGVFQALYFATPWLAIGGLVADEYFDHDIASGVDMDVDTWVYNYLFSARIFVNPQQKYKFYIPIGVGKGDVSVRIDMDPHEKFRYSGFAGHAGLGVTQLFSEHWAWAFELSYNYNKFHSTKVTSRNEVYRLYPRLNYISAALQISYRF